VFKINRDRAHNNTCFALAVNSTYNCGGTDGISSEFSTSSIKHNNCTVHQLKVCTHLI